MYLLDEYVVTAPGQPFRLFPFGELVKNGKRRIINAESAAKFKLPHFKPPIKLGSHDEPTPAGGFIIGLEVREDGLYAVPEYTEKGGRSIEEGDYRYHSPEVIWEGGLENPATGELIEGPLIIGDALLHTPHLGEAAALYTIEPLNREVKTMTETIEVPKGWFERVMEFFKAPVVEEKPEPQPEPEPEKPAMDVEKFEAVQAERDEYRAQLDALKAEADKKARLDQFTAKLQEAKVDIEDGAEMLSSMTDEQAEWVLTRFKALSAQVDEGKLFEEKGTSGDGLPDNPADKMTYLIKQRAEEKGIDWHTAYMEVSRENPELFGAKGGK
jgi:hypothetical protein